MSSKYEKVAQRIECLFKKYPQMPLKERLNYAYQYVYEGNEDAIYGDGGFLDWAEQNIRTDDVLTQSNLDKFISAALKPKDKLEQYLKSQDRPMEKVVSSNVAQVGYLNNKLFVRFKGGSLYSYEVEPSFHTRMMAKGESKGKFVWKYLRGKRPGGVYDYPKKQTPGGVPGKFGKGGIVPYEKVEGAPSVELAKKIAARKIDPKEIERLQVLIKQQISASKTLTVSKRSIGKDEGLKRQKILQEIRAELSKLGVKYGKDFTVIWDVEPAGRWVTIRGKHIFIKKGEKLVFKEGGGYQKLSKAEALKRKIKEKGIKKVKLPETATQKKAREQTKKEAVRRGAEEIRRRKAIDRMARAAKKEKVEKPTPESERKRKVQKLIEKTGYDRERAEQIVDKKLQAKKEIAEAPKREKAKAEKQRKENERIAKQMKRKQETIQVRITKLNALRQGKSYSSMIGGLIQLVMKMIEESQKTGSSGGLVPFSRYIDKIRRDKRIKDEQKRKLISQINKLNDEVGALAGEDFITEDSKTISEYIRHCYHKHVEGDKSMTHKQCIAAAHQKFGVSKDFIKLIVEDLEDQLNECKQSFKKKGLSDAQAEDACFASFNKAEAKAKKKTKKKTKKRETITTPLLEKSARKRSFGILEGGEKRELKSWEVAQLSRELRAKSIEKLNKQVKKDPKLKAKLRKQYVKLHQKRRIYEEQQERMMIEGYSVNKTKLGKNIDNLEKTYREIEKFEQILGYPSKIVEESKTKHVIRRLEGERRRLLRTIEKNKKTAMSPSARAINTRKYNKKLKFVRAKLMMFRSLISDLIAQNYDFMSRILVDLSESIQFNINVQSDFIVSDFQRINDNTFEGVLTRSGRFLYRDSRGRKIVKYKDWNNLKDYFSKQKILIGYGSKMPDSHMERDDRFIGYAHRFKFIEPNIEAPDGTIDKKEGRVWFRGHTIRPMSELSDVPDLRNIPVSLSFDDIGSGNKQIISRAHSFAVSFNKNERDRCSTLSGSSCNMTPRSTIKSRNRDTYDFDTNLILKIKKSDYMSVEYDEDGNIIEITADVDDTNDLSGEDSSVAAVEKRISDCQKTGKSREQCAELVKKGSVQSENAEKAKKDMEDKMKALEAENKKLKEDNEKNTSDFKEKVDKFQDFMDGINAEKEKEIEVRRQKLIKDLQDKPYYQPEDEVKDEKLEGLEKTKKALDFLIKKELNKDEDVIEGDLVQQANDFMLNEKDFWKEDPNSPYFIRDGRGAK